MSQQLLNSIKYLIKLSDEETDFLLSLFTPITLKKGEYFLQEGKISTQVAFIEKGLLRYLMTHNGEEINYYFSKENEWTGNYESMLSRKPSAKSILALEPTTLWTITADNLQKIYTAVKEGDRMGRLIIEDVFVKSLQQLTSLYTISPEERYREFFDIFHGMEHRIPQYMIASFIGVKPQSLSRIRNRLAKNIN
jgi:CRP-like cAMP-binding protein